MGGVAFRVGFAVQRASLLARLVDEKELELCAVDGFFEHHGELLAEGGAVEHVATPVPGVLECQPGGGASGGAAERLVVVEGAGVRRNLGGAGA